MNTSYFANEYVLLFGGGYKTKKTELIKVLSFC